MLCLSFRFCRDHDSKNFRSFAVFFKAEFRSWTFLQQETNWPLVFNVKDAWFCEVFRDVYLSKRFNKKLTWKKEAFYFPSRLAVSSSTSLVIVFSPRLWRDFSELHCLHIIFSTIPLVTSHCCFAHVNIYTQVHVTVLFPPNLLLPDFFDQQLDAFITLDLLPLHDCLGIKVCPHFLLQCDNHVVRHAYT